MKNIKVEGGLTHGRHVTESNILRFLAMMVMLLDVTAAIEEFCNVTYETSEQHADLGQTNISRAAADYDKMLNFFKQHNPFPHSDKLVSITTGIIGNEKTNCHKARNIDMKSIEKNH